MIRGEVLKGRGISSFSNDKCHFFILSLTFPFVISYIIRGFNSFSMLKMSNTMRKYVKILHLKDQFHFNLSIEVKNELNTSYASAINIFQKLIIKGKKEKIVKNELHIFPQTTQVRQKKKK